MWALYLTIGWSCRQFQQGYDRLTLQTNSETSQRSIEFERKLHESELFSSPANNVDDFCKQLAIVVTREMDRVAPQKVSSRRKSKPITRWLSPAAIRAKRTRRRLERAGKNEEDRNKMSNCQQDHRQFKKWLQEAAASYCANPGYWWEAVKDILHMNNTSSDMQLDHGNNQHMCTSFIDYFKSKIVSIHKTIIGKLPTLHPSPRPHSHRTNPWRSLSCRTWRQLYSCKIFSPRLYSNLTSLILVWGFLTSHIQSCQLVFLTTSLPCYVWGGSTAQVPILTKIGLPSPANFRPILNLNSISKILDRLFLSRQLPHTNSSSNFNAFQSAYRPHQSTEIALTLTLDNVFHAVDTGSATLLVSLGLSGAFDSINHNILINRLSSGFGLTGLALNWISSYMNNRQQSVKIGDACSPLSDIASGVPQRSVLGPNLSVLHTSPISAIANAHNVLQQQYADDTKLYISTSAKTETLNTDRLESCLPDLHAWFSHNWLALNPFHSEAYCYEFQINQNSN